MFPVLLKLGPIHIASYGALVASGYIASILWLKRRRGAMGLSEERFWELIYRLFFGAIAGGKLLFMLLNWQSFASGELHLLRDFRYGFVFFGGFLGAVAMGWVYVRRRQLSFFKIADYFGVALPFGHAIGRIGCLAAGCCYGRPTALPWAISFGDPRSLVPDFILGTPLHPAQLYEALGNAAIALALRPALRRTESGALRPGAVFWGYASLYSLLRFLVEFSRGDDRGGFWLHLSPSQWIALACLTAGAWFLSRASQPGLARRA